MELGLRFDDYFISANLVVLALAGGFFALLAWQHLGPLSARSRLVMLGSAGFFGVVGAYIYGMAGFLTEPAPPGDTPTLFEFHFGSFGGFWGVLVGAAAGGLLLERRNVFTRVAAFVPAILAGGAIARVADLFTNASAGRPWTLGNTDIMPMEPWALYDIAVLVLLYFVVQRTGDGSPAKATRFRNPVLIFLLGYGVLRFLLEFGRLTQTPFGPLTWGQVMCLVQIIVGLGLLGLLQPDEPQSEK